MDIHDQHMAIGPGSQNPNYWHDIQKWSGMGIGAFQEEINSKLAKGGVSAVECPRAIFAKSLHRWQKTLSGN